MLTSGRSVANRAKGGHHKIDTGTCRQRRLQECAPASLRGILLPFLALFLPLVFLPAGCAAPKKAPAVQEDDFFAMVPAVELSEEVIYSPEGDMKARLPDGWVTLDDARFGNPEIFAVACDPEYRMVIVFSEIPMDQALGEVFRSKGMMGLLQANFNERLSRMSGPAPQLLAGEEFALGRRKFGAYAFTADSGATMTRVALYYTPKHLYECAISNLPYTESDVPSSQTIKDIHQVVLGGIEW